MTTIQGADIPKFAAKVIAKGLEVYALHGIRVNRMYTPKRMMQYAIKVTGKQFGPRQYMEAAKALKKWSES